MYEQLYLITFLALIANSIYLGLVKYGIEEKNKESKASSLTSNIFMLLFPIIFAIILLRLFSINNGIFYTFIFSIIVGIICLSITNVYTTLPKWYSTINSLSILFSGISIMLILLYKFNNNNIQSSYLIFLGIALILQIISYTTEDVDDNSKTKKTFISLWIISLIVILGFNIYMFFPNISNIFNYLSVVSLPISILGIIVSIGLIVFVIIYAVMKNSKKYIYPPSLLPLYPPNYPSPLPLHPPNYPSPLPLHPPNYPSPLPLEPSKFKEGCYNANNDPQELSPVDEKTLEQIIKNLNNFYAIDNCQNSESSDCNYLYKQLTTNKKMSYKDVDRILDSMKDDALINQNIYLIYQLMQCKLILKNPPETQITTFGTWRWLLENIWNNPFQVFIYFITFMISFVVLGLVVYNICKTIYSKNDSYDALVFAIVLAIIYIVLFSLMRVSQTETIYNVPNFLRKYLPNKKPGENTSEIDSSRASMGLKIMMPILLIGLTAVSSFIDNKTIRALNIGSWLGLLFGVNLFYTVMVPQVVFLGIILQKFILMTPLGLGNDMSSLFILLGKGLIFIIVLLTTLAETQYKSKTVKKTTDEAEAGNDVGDTIIQEESGSTTGLFIWYLFGIMLSFFFVNLLNTVEGKNYLDGSKLSIPLAPLFRYIINFSSYHNKAQYLQIENYSTPS